MKRKWHLKQETDFNPNSVTDSIWVCVYVCGWNWLQPVRFVNDINWCSGYMHIESNGFISKKHDLTAYVTSSPIVKLAFRHSALKTPQTGKVLVDSQSELSAHNNKQLGAAACSPQRSQAEAVYSAEACWTHKPTERNVTAELSCCWTPSLQLRVREDASSVVSIST